MSYINKRSKVFMAGQSKLVVPVRSEARMKEYISTTDARAWSDIVEERRQHILEYAAKNKEGFSLNKFIPIDIIFNTMLAGKNIEIQEMRKKMECLERIINMYSKIELVDVQQSQLNKLRAEIEKDYGIDCLQSFAEPVNAISEIRRILDGGENSEQKSKTKRKSLLSHSSKGAELDKISETSKESKKSKNLRESIIFINSKEEIDEVSENSEISKESQKSKNKRASINSHTSNGAEIDEISELNDISKEISELSGTSKDSKKSKRESINSRSSNGAEIDKISEGSKISKDSKKSKRESINSRSSNGAELDKISEGSEISKDSKKSKRESIISRSSNGAEMDEISEGSEISKDSKKSKRESIISRSSNGAEMDKISEGSENSTETRSTNTDTITSQHMLIETERTKYASQTAYCKICPCVNECEIECMKQKLDDLKSKSKEAEILKLERDKLQIQLNELSYLQVQFDNLRLKCCCLESATQERDMYKQKYDEAVSKECECQKLRSEYDNLRLKCFAVETAAEENYMYKQKYEALSKECQCEKLRSQADAAKDLAIERDALVKQVSDLKMCICKQEEEINALEARIDNLTNNHDEIESHRKEELSSMKAEIEEKDQVIAMLKKKLPAVQNKMKCSIKRVSCKITCLKTRIEELEGNLGQSQLENEELKKQVKDNETHLKGAMHLIKREYEALAAMKQEVHAAQAENKKLHQIANKMIALTGDENVKKVLKQSECAINRAVEELQKQYNEWDSYRRNKKKVDFVKDGSNKVKCKCKCKVKIAVDSESNEKLNEELNEIQREKEKLEKLVEQIKNDDLSCVGQQLIYSFKNSLCKFTRLATDEDKSS